MPAPGQCQLWWADLVHSAGTSLTALLDRDEQRRLAGLRRPADRDRFVTGTSLLRLVVGRCLGLPPGRLVICRRCPTCGRPHGKPQLVGPPAPSVQFSVSHSGGRVALALTTGRAVGVDIEQIRPDVPVEDLTRSVLSSEESERLRGVLGPDRVRAFLSLWTAKEAALKAVGTGLALPLAETPITGDGDTKRLLSWPPGWEILADVRLLERWNRDYVAHVATIGTLPELVEFDGSSELRSWTDRG